MWANLRKRGVAPATRPGAAQRRWCCINNGSGAGRARRRVAKSLALCGRAGRARCSHLRARLAVFRGSGEGQRVCAMIGGHIAHSSNGECVGAPVPAFGDRRPGATARRPPSKSRQVAPAARYSHEAPSASYVGSRTCLPSPRRDPARATRGNRCASIRRCRVRMEVCPSSAESESLPE